MLKLIFPLYGTKLMDLDMSSLKHIKYHDFK
jgi:hypothetical protein